MHVQQKLRMPLLHIRFSGVRREGLTVGDNVMTSCGLKNKWVGHSQGRLAAGVIQVLVHGDKAALACVQTHWHACCWILVAVPLVVVY